ncbi:histidine kinase [Streptosporangium sp. KLBMP 9127]|nr:histidine kinase [Streptosporangium sp. KLBMP 9127]
MTRTGLPLKPYIVRCRARPSLVGNLRAGGSGVMGGMRRSLMFAGATFVAGLVLLAVGVYTERDTPPWLLVFPLLVGCVGVALRRRAPMATLALGVVAVSGDLALGPSVATIVIFTDNLYAATLYGPRRYINWILGFAAVMAVGAGTAALYVTHDWRTVALMGVQVGVVVTTPVLTAVLVRQHRDQARAERARAEQVARLVELDRQAAVNAERTRMARELHDMIANHFSAIAIQSTAVLSRKDLSPQAVSKVLESIRENSVQGMSEMRSMIELLREEGEEAEAIRRRLADSAELVERSTQSGVATELDVSGSARDLPPSVDLAGYRIVQEALTNVLKHGDKRASVVISYELEHVTVTVENAVNGRTNELPGAGAGLIGMRERTALVGGEFEAGPYEGGWRVRATLPTKEQPS